jgi:uncharacterized membrane protein
MSSFFKASSRSRQKAIAPIALYATALAILSVSLVAGLVVAAGPAREGRSLWPLLGFALLAVLAERQSVRLTETIELSVAFLPLLFVAVVFGPLPAALIGAATLIADFRRPFTRWVIWTSSRTLVAGLAGLAASLTLQHGGSTFGRILAATAVAAIVDFALDFVFNAVTLALRGTGSAKDLARTTGPVALAGIPLYTSLVGVLAYSYIAFTPWSAALFFIPALAAQRLFVMYREQRDAVSKLGNANARLERAGISFATALVATLDARDRYTAGHSAAVAIYYRTSRLGWALVCRTNSLSIFVA